MKKLILIGALCAFATSAFAQQKPPVDVSSVLMHKQAFVTLTQDLITSLDQMAQEIVTLREENEKLKADLAKAKPTAPTTAPSAAP